MRKRILNIFQFIIIIVSLSFGIILTYPCMFYDYFGQKEMNFCGQLIGAGGCGFSPFISSLFCGKTCGFCPQPNISKLKELTNKTWKPIQRIKFNDLNYDEFVKNYKIPGIPLIIEDWLSHPKYSKMATWNLKKLSEKCGHVPVSCKQRRVAAIKILTKMIHNSPFIMKLINIYLTIKYGKTLSSGLEDAEQSYLLSDFIQTIQNQQLNVIFQTPLDYLASAITVNDFPAVEMCPEFADDLVLPEWSTRESLLFYDKSEDRRFSPNIFIEPDGARAYPGHQHGYDVTHGFQVMLDGAKKVVFWPYSEGKHLYKSDITTENHEEIYFAEGVAHRFDLFPSMALAEAFEGEVKRGDIMYVPCSGIHVFESHGPSLGIRFMHQDQHSVTCGYDLLKANSTTVNKPHMKHLSELQTIIFNENEDFHQDSKEKEQKEKIDYSFMTLKELSVLVDQVMISKGLDPKYRMRIQPQLNRDEIFGEYLNSQFVATSSTDIKDPVGSTNQHKKADPHTRKKKKKKESSRHKESNDFLVEEL